MGDLIRLVVDRPAAGLRPSARPAVAPDTRHRLTGASLRWKRYRRWTVAWIVGRCELCHARFSEDGDTGTLHSGYSVVGGGPAGQDDFYWVCGVCAEFHADDLDWTILDTFDRRPSR